MHGQNAKTWGKHTHFGDEGYWQTHEVLRKKSTMQCNHANKDVKLKVSLKSIAAENSANKRCPYSGHWPNSNYKTLTIDL